MSLWPPLAHQHLIQSSLRWFSWPPWPSGPWVPLPLALLLAPQTLQALRVLHPLPLLEAYLCHVLWLCLGRLFLSLWEQQQAWQLPLVLPLVFHSAFLMDLYSNNPWPCPDLPQWMHLGGLGHSLAMWPFRPQLWHTTSDPVAAAGLPCATCTLSRSPVILIRT